MGTAAIVAVYPAAVPSGVAAHGPTAPGAPDEPLERPSLLVFLPARFPRPPRLYLATCSLEQLLRDDGFVDTLPRAVTISELAEIDGIRECGQDLASRPGIASPHPTGPSPLMDLRAPATLVRDAGDLARPPAFCGHGEHLPHPPGFLSIDHESLRERICVIAVGNRAAYPLALALEGSADLGYAAADEFPLELRKNAQDVDDEVVLGRGAQFRIRDYNQGNTPLSEFLEELESVDDVPGQAIQAVDENAVYLAAAHFFEETLEGRSVEGGAGVSFIVETLSNPPPSQPLLGLEVVAADLELGLARGEITASINGLAGVDGAAGNRKACWLPRQGNYCSPSRLL